MKEKQIIYDIVSLLQTELPAFASVQTRGGDRDDVTLPSVTLNWSKDRLSANGANPHAGFDLEADPPVEILHRYYSMGVTFEVKSEDEALSYDLADAVEDAFLPFERESNDFHPDTYEWEVGDAEPAPNTVMEPDWYQHECGVSFRYVKETTREIDTLDNVQHTINTKY